MHVPRPFQSLREEYLPAEVSGCLCRTASRSLCGFSACAGVSGSFHAFPNSCTGHRAASCSCHHCVHEMGNGSLPPAKQTSLPCAPLVPITNQAPYLLGSHPQSCNVAVEIFAVTISCEGGFPGEWCRSLQDMEGRHESPSPEDKMAKPHWGKKSAGELLLIYMELKFKHCCGRHIVNGDGACVADMV